jgi:SAM-dependent methyltransferase
LHYYSRLAPAWHEAVGDHGGPLKSLVLNDLLIDTVDPLGGKAVLEVGAGNGYLMPRLLARHPDEPPERLVISDGCRPMLDLARKHFPVPGAEYQVLELGHVLHHDDGSFDLIVADMVLHELNTARLRMTLAELRRLLRPGGAVVGTVYHPRYVESLKRAGRLARARGGLRVMPGPGGLYVPIIERRTLALHTAFTRWGRLALELHKVFATPDFFEELLPDLKQPLRLPVALQLRATPAEGDPGGDDEADDGGLDDGGLDE